MKPDGSLMLLLWQLCLLLLMEGDPALSCPSMCSCDNYGPKHATDCDSQDLNAIPSGIPEWTTELSLDGNYLIELDLADLRPTEFYEELSIRYNEIERLRVSSFSSSSSSVGKRRRGGLRGACNFVLDIFPRVKYFNMRGNRLAALPKCLLLALPVLETLNLNENRFGSLASLHLASYQPQGGTLHELLLRGNRIRRLARRELYAPYSSVGNLRLLDLGENRIANVDSAALMFFPHLAEIKLDGNLISALPPFAFITTDGKLRTISLAGNRIAAIGESAFAGLPALERLDLSNNLIRCLTPGAYLTCQPQVNNQTIPARWLSTLQRRFEMDLGALRVLGVAGNPWVCTCPLRTLLEDPAAQRVAPRLGSERCAAPESARRRRLGSWVNDQTACD